MFNDDRLMLNGDRDELHAIKRELSALRSSKLDSSPDIPPPRISPGIPLTSQESHENKDPQLGRWIEEKRQLLQSHAYTGESFLIQELDRRIYLATGQTQSRSDNN